MSTAIHIDGFFDNQLPKGQLTRVLIVDDSVVARRIITQALSKARGIEVVGTAPNAEIGLDKIPTLKPDLLILDIHMPGMSGLDLLPILQHRFPTLKILFFSVGLPSLSPTDAIIPGVIDFLNKPSADVSLAQYLSTLKTDLELKIRRLMQHPKTPVVEPPDQSACTSSLPAAEPIPTTIYMRRATDQSTQSAYASPPLAGQPAVTTNPMRRITDLPYRILAVGVSTGGPAALATFMAGFPRGFSLPIVIVQHMPPVFTKLLADRLRAQTGFSVTEAFSGMSVEPGKVILAPGNFHMRLKRSGEQVIVTLDQGPQECSCRPSVDVLFRSVSEIYGKAAIGAVLTGMGQDGLKGATCMKNAGAYLIVQDEASSVVWGMPGAIANAGLADDVIDIGSMAKTILKKLRS